MSLLFQSPIQYEPKTKNRFILIFPTDVAIQTFHVVKAGAPKIDMTKKEMNFINTQTYVNTSFKWNEITITMRDFIAPSGSQAVMEWVRLCAESVTGRMGYAVGYAKDLIIQTLDPTGVVISQWVLEKCIPVTFSSYDFDYDAPDIATIELVVQPQRCILTF